MKTSIKQSAWNLAHLTALGLATLGLVSTSASAAVVSNTIATFADPNTTVFEFVDIGSDNDGLGILDARNNDIVVNLPALGLTFSDASFVLDNGQGNPLQTQSQVSINGILQGTFGAGELVIKTDVVQHGLLAGDTILKASFDSALMVFGNVFSADAFVGNDVVFSGFAVQGQALTGESFAFSAANINPADALIGLPDMKDWSSTASFTSSAAAVPIPGAAFFFLSGLSSLLIARKRSQG